MRGLTGTAAFVSTADEVARARNAGAAAFVSTAGKGASAEFAVFELLE